MRRVEPSRLSGSGRFRVWGFGFRVCGFRLGFRARGFGLGFRLCFSGLGFKVQGLRV